MAAHRTPRRTPPQPSLERIPDFPARPLVVGVTPEPAPVLVRTAVRLASALGAPTLHLAFSDTSRTVVREDADGTVLHTALDPDSDDAWEERAAALETRLAALLEDAPLSWRFHYLAGRPDRALTHLARAMDAGLIVVGTRGPGLAEHLRETLEGSVAAHLSQHQHRPVVTVPLSVVDWKEPVRR